MQRQSVNKIYAQEKEELQIKFWKTSISVCLLISFYISQILE